MHCHARWIIGLVLLVAPFAAPADVSISIQIAPPALPVYEQPPVPAPGYLWTPGYWSYGEEGYLWVPGAWVEAPFRGALWTPGYWGWVGGAYVWNRGYWGLHVGFYGGVPYGFGYTGVGFAGGAWREGHFAYNQTVTNVNTTIITHTYSQRVTEVPHSVHASYNGGPGGIEATPTEQERRAMTSKHVPAVAAQVQHEHVARADRTLLASVNNGKPAVAAVARPVTSVSQLHSASMPATHAVGSTPAASTHAAVPTRVPPSGMAVQPHSASPSGSAITGGAGASGAQPHSGAIAQRPASANSAPSPHAASATATSPRPSAAVPMRPSAPAPVAARAPVSAAAPAHAPPPATTPVNKSKSEAH